MGRYEAPWAAVLAAGDGTRLRALTTDSKGRAIPKQFCSLTGGPSLLQLALGRAARVVPASRIATIVGAQHEHWWRAELDAADPNVVVQPRNRGTAVGALLILLRVLDRNPDAHVVLLPSDHFVADERALERAMRVAIGEVERRPERLVLLGIVPDEPDPGFGWIVPASPGGCGVQPVQRFVEKPPEAVAAGLMAQGAVWNSFILAAAGSTMLAMFEEKLPEVVAALRDALEREAAAEVYDALESFDFCRDVLQGLEDRLSVLPVPWCGWSDLGTPERVARALEGIPSASPSAAPSGAWLDLAQASLALQPFLTSGDAGASGPHESPR